MPVAGDIVGSAGAIILPFRLSADWCHPGLDRTVQAHIALALRQMYSDLLAEPVPERFVEHLAELNRKKSEGGMSVEPSLRDELLAAIPSLRAFATSLVHDRDRADDLVQDTIVRAWGAIDRFERGTNLNAWLFTILRNLFHSDYRKKKREVDDPDGTYAAKLKTAPDQQLHLDYEDMRSALAKLRPDQREALLLVTAEGLSYEEAAAICGTAEGTIKSRVNRARLKLAELLHRDPADEIGPDRLTKAALQAGP